MTAFPILIVLSATFALGFLPKKSTHTNYVTNLETPRFAGGISRFKKETTTMEDHTEFPNDHVLLLNEDGRGSPRSVYDDNSTIIDPETNEHKSTGSCDDDEIVPSGRTRRRVSFMENLTTATIEVPAIEPEQKGELFYNKTDFARFHQDEQRRFDKMMMKKIQKMVEEKMADQLAEAYARGASPEEIAAMMPQTPEEIFALLGGDSAIWEPPKLPTLREPAHAPRQAEKVVAVVLPADADEAQDHADAEERFQDEAPEGYNEPEESYDEGVCAYNDESNDETENQVSGCDNEPKLAKFLYTGPKIEDRKLSDFSDDDIYALLGVDEENDKEALPDAEKDEHEISREIHDVGAFVDKEDSENDEQKLAKFLYTGPKVEDRKLSDFSDDDIYDLLGVDGDIIQEEELHVKATEGEAINAPEAALSDKVEEGEKMESQETTNQRKEQVKESTGQPEFSEGSSHEPVDSEKEGDKSTTGESARPKRVKVKRGQRYVPGALAGKLKGFKRSKSPNEDDKAAAAEKEEDHLRSTSQHASHSASNVTTNQIQKSELAPLTRADHSLAEKESREKQEGEEEVEAEVWLRKQDHSDDVRGISVSSNEQKHADSVTDEPGKLKQDLLRAQAKSNEVSAGVGDTADLTEEDNPLNCGHEQPISILSSEELKKSSSSRTPSLEPFSTPLLIEKPSKEGNSETAPTPPSESPSLGPSPNGKCMKKKNDHPVVHVKKVVYHVKDEEKWNIVEPVLDASRWSKDPLSKSDHSTLGKPKPESPPPPPPQSATGSASSVSRKKSNSNTHTTRKASAPKPKQRHSYDVGGNWGNPLMFGK